MPGSKVISPLRGWLGGKYRMTKHIIQLIPEHTLYAEVFAGAAWVLFHKQQSKVEVINDINAEIINLYRIVQNHYEELVRQFEYALTSRDEFARLKAQNSESLTDIQRAARFLYLHRACFGGHVAHPSFSARTFKKPKLIPEKLAAELSESAKRLSYVLIERMNYDEFIARYDKIDTFFYVDPPYYGCEEVYGKGIFAKDDFQKLATQLSGIKGKFLLSINDTPQIREIFHGFEMREIKQRYSLNKSNQHASELLIANYALD